MANPTPHLSMRQNSHAWKTRKPRVGLASAGPGKAGRDASRNQNKGGSSQREIPPFSPISREQQVRLDAESSALLMASQAQARLLGQMTWDRSSVPVGEVPGALVSNAREAGKPSPGANVLSTAVDVGSAVPREGGKRKGKRTARSFMCVMLRKIAQKLGVWSQLRTPNPPCLSGAELLLLAMRPGVAAPEACLIFTVDEFQLVKVYTKRFCSLGRDPSHRVGLGVKASMCDMAPYLAQLVVVGTIRTKGLNPREFWLSRQAEKQHRSVGQTARHESTSEDESSTDQSDLSEEECSGFDDEPAHVVKLSDGPKRPPSPPGVCQCGNFFRPGGCSFDQCWHRSHTVERTKPVIVGGLEAVGCWPDPPCEIPYDSICHKVEVLTSGRLALIEVEDPIVDTRVVHYVDLTSGFVYPPRVVKLEEELHSQAPLPRLVRRVATPVEAHRANTIDAVLECNSGIVGSVPLCSCDDVRSHVNPGSVAKATTRRKNRRNRGGQVRQRAGAYLSQCASDYADVLENPFSGRVACFPTTTNFPSMKHSVRSQGVFATGGEGFGFVCCVPFAMFYNNLGAVFSSTVSYTGSVIAQGGATGGQVANSNSPYVIGENATQLKCRLVACGLRVRNITAQLQRGGQLVGLETLNHTPANDLSIAACMLMDTTERCSPFAKEWASVVWHPQDEDESDFLDSDDVIDNELYNGATLAFAAQASGSDATLAQLYEYEVYAVFEAKGQSVHGLTPSYNDPVGLAAVQNATASTEARKPIVGDRLAKATSTIARSAEHLSRILPQLVEVAAFAAPAVRAAAPVVRAAGQLANRLQAPQRVARLAYSSTECVPFPVNIAGVGYALYAVARTFTSDVRSTSLDGWGLSNYVGKMTMKTGGSLRFFRVDPHAWVTGVVREVAGPPVTGQSCQYACSVLLSEEVPCDSDLVYTGSIAFGVVQRNIDVVGKRQFVESLGLRLISA